MTAAEGGFGAGERGGQGKKKSRIWGQGDWRGTAGKKPRRGGGPSGDFGRPRVCRRFRFYQHGRFAGALAWQLKLRFRVEEREHPTTGFDVSVVVDTGELANGRGKEAGAGVVLCREWVRGGVGGQVKHKHPTGQEPGGTGGLDPAPLCR